MWFEASHLSICASYATHLSLDCLLLSNQSLWPSLLSFILSWCHSVLILVFIINCLWKSQTNYTWPILVSRAVIFQCCHLRLMYISHCSNVLTFLLFSWLDWADKAGSLSAASLPVLYEGGPNCHLFSVSRVLQECYHGSNGNSIWCHCWFHRSVSTYPLLYFLLLLW